MTGRLSFKCRKCRHLLFECRDVTNRSECELLENEVNVWYIAEESFPDWILAAVNQAEWTKGKLNCPKCVGRLGSFNFISGPKYENNPHPVHLNKSRVDCDIFDEKSSDSSQLSPASDKTQ